MFQHLPATSNGQSTHPMISASNTPSYSLSFRGTSSQPTVAVQSPINTSPVVTQPPINISPVVVQPSNIHFMQTRAKSGIFKPKVYSYSHTALASSINEVEPIADPRWKLQWRLSMKP